MAVDLSGAVDADVLTQVNGYQGTLQRFVQSKITMDNEWGTDGMVYQDDYPQLLRVAQTGERLTNTPQNAASLLGEWPKLTRGACGEIAQLSKLRPALKVQFLAQLCAGPPGAAERRELPWKAAVE